MVVAAAVAIPTAIAQSPRDAPQPRAPDTWQIEYLREGKVWGRWIEPFASFQDAQAELENQRQAHARLGWGRLAARIVTSQQVERRLAGQGELGTLSAQEESGGRGPGVVSTGQGDAGGVSYGTYQLSTNSGNARRFVEKFYPGRFAGLEPGTEKFTAAWKSLAEERPEELAALEHQYIADTHYLPQVKKLAQEAQFDLTRRSHVLQDVVWSTAVQHGPNTRIVIEALRGLQQNTPAAQLTDRKIIEAIYAERGRKDAQGRPVHFLRSSPRVQAAVLRRFERECAAALGRLQQ
jgi:hypothetical protein